MPNCSNPDWVDHVTSKEKLIETLNKFKEGGEHELSEGDSLFFTFIDHGGNENVGD